MCCIVHSQDTVVYGSSLTTDFFPAATLGGSHRADGNKGPWKPDDVEAQQDTELTACRHCGWFSLFRHHNFSPCHFIGRYASYDNWCHACGRVASIRDLGKNQGRPTIRAFLSIAIIPTARRRQESKIDDRNTRKHLSWHQDDRIYHQSAQSLRNGQVQVTVDGTLGRR